MLVWVPAGAGGKVVCLFPLLYPSNHSRTEQTRTLDRRYGERQSARSCIGRGVTQKHGTRSKPAQMHRQYDGRKLQAGLCLATAMGAETTALPWGKGAGWEPGKAT